MEPKVKPKKAFTDAEIVTECVKSFGYIADWEVNGKIKQILQSGTTEITFKYVLYFYYCVHRDFVFHFSKHISLLFYEIYFFFKWNDR